MADDENSMSDEERNNRAQELLEEGTNYFSHREWARALGYFTKAINLNPNLIEAYTARANTQIKLQKYERAIEDYTEIIRLQPNHAPDYNNRGTANVYDGKYEESIIDFDNAIRINPNYHEAYHNRGISKTNCGQYKEAIVDFEEALRLKPDFVEAHVGCGIAKVNIEEYSGAVASFDSAINLNPDYAQAYYNRGSAKVGLHEYKAAIADYDTVLALESEYAEVYNERGIAMAYDGQLDEAFESNSKALRLLQGVQDNTNFLMQKIYAFRVYLRCRRKEQEDAYKDYHQATTLYKRNILNTFPSLLVHLWCNLIHLEEYEDVAKEIFPDFVDLLNYDYQLDSYTDELPSGSIFWIWFAKQFRGKEEKVYNNEYLSNLFVDILPFYKIVRNTLNDASVGEDNREFAHYTSLGVLRFLVGLLPSENNHEDVPDTKENDKIISSEYFRLYDISYANDPREGKILFDKLGKKICKSFGLRDRSDNKLIPCIGSFVFVEDDIQTGGEPLSRDDALTLWRLYGKSNDIETTGCNLVYSRNKFAPKQEDICLLKLIDEFALISREKRIVPLVSDFQTSTESDVMHSSNIALSGRGSLMRNMKHKLFEVRYVSDDFNPNKEIRDIKSALENMHNKRDKFIKAAVQVLIDWVRFLYKSHQFKDEREARIIRLSFPDEAKIDYQNNEISPRYYIRAGKEFIPIRIFLGPNAPDGWESFLQNYLRNTEIKVEKSKIPFKTNKHE